MAEQSKISVDWLVEQYKALSEEDKDGFLLEVAQVHRDRDEFPKPIERIVDLIEEWQNSSTERIRLGQFVLWGFNEHDLDIRDLRLLVEICISHSEREAFVGLYDYVEAWRKYMAMSNNTINKLHQKISNTKNYIIDSPAVPLNRERLIAYLSGETP